MEQSTLSLKNKIIGSVLGGAYGDAFGLPVELWSKDFLQKKLDSYKEFTFTVNNLKYLNTIIKTHKNDFIGEYSDDTEMSLNTIESILNCATINSEKLLGTFKKNYNKNRGYGSNTSKILENSINNEDKIQQSDSNGGLMRICPVAIWNSYTNNYELMKDIKNNLKVTNHDTNKSIQVCYLFSKIINNFIKTNNITIDDFITFLEKELENGDKDYKYNYDEIKDYIFEVLNNYKNDNNKSNEYKLVDNMYTYSTDCVETLQKVINALLYHWNNPLESLSYIVSYGGDTDTNAGILGSIQGTRFGDAYIIEKFNIIENSMNIINTANKFADFVIYRKNNLEKNYYTYYGL